VRVRGLEKSYGDLRALDGIDLEIHRGEVFGLLGPNGAGKTTTVEILEGYRSRDRGEVSVLGLDPSHQRSRLKPLMGIVLQSTGIEPYLTVAETVTFYSRLYPHPRPVEEVLGLVELTPKRNQRVKQLSGGQQRRLEMAIALSGDPEILFLDEPTTGFDPSARREAWDIVKNLASLGKTVLLTTHFMDEAEYLADRVAVISGGKVVAEGRPATLGRRDRAGVRVRFRLPDGVALPLGLAGPTGTDGITEVTFDDPVHGVHRLTGWAIEQGVDLDGLEVLRPTLEDVYLELTDGPGAGDASAGGGGGRP
jgi:ABC-2 type transport system ATP-binding protein